MAVFLTGATGFLGRYLVKSLVDGGEEVVALVRGKDAPAARARLDAALAEIGGIADPQALTVVVGSLDRPRLGLAAADRERVLSDTRSLLHCGANVRFDLPLAEARRTNVDGTRAVLELARDLARGGDGRLDRIDYVGTAYVAGNRTDVAHEHELDGRLGHKNSYEATKFEAETLVRAAQRTLPIAIHRPSIVVGEAASGRTSSFKMIYWPARIYATGLWRIVPGHPRTPIDLVPVDFVRDAVLALRARPSTVGGCYHLAAGTDGVLRLEDFARLLAELFPGRSPVRFVDPAWWMRFVHPVLKRVAIGRTRKVIRTGEFYVPYFTRNPLFDIANARRELDAAGVSVPRVETYVRHLFDYAIATDWGTRKMPMTSSSREKK